MTRITASWTVWLVPALGMALGAAPASGQDMDIRFDPAATGACLAAATDDPTWRACIGISAAACTEATSDGYTTVGTSICFGRELDWWDARLNDAYAALVAQNTALQEEMAGYGASIPPLVAPLREMQRAWIAYRDASCEYERATWGGGTGGGPAAVACRMTLTAEQAMRLEDYLAQR